MNSNLKIKLHVALPHLLQTALVLLVLDLHATYTT